MADWNATGYDQYLFFRGTQAEGGTGIFVAGALTATVTIRHLSKIYTGFLGYKASGVAGGGVFDVPLTSPFTISAKVITVTRPGIAGEDATFWYLVFGH